MNIHQHLDEAPIVRIVPDLYLKILSRLGQDIQVAIEVILGSVIQCGIDSEELFHHRVSNLYIVVLKALYPGNLSQVHLLRPS